MSTLNTHLTPHELSPHHSDEFEFFMVCIPREIMENSTEKGMPISLSLALETIPAWRYFTVSRTYLAWSFRTSTTRYLRKSSIPLRLLLKLVTFCLSHSTEFSRFQMASK